MESTNVYTAEAFEAYKAIVDGAQQKYDEGTLTQAEAGSFVNPEVVTGWRAGNDFDDMLLSAWTINDVQCNNFDTNLYINSWSVEGETDGSEFKVPFFEYWTGDDQSLGATTLTATQTGLSAGLKYDVSVWVRVRAKNGYTAPAYGITLDVNGGEAVDVAAGSQIGTSQFFLAEYTATGVADENGVLKINFNIAADNNISWLSFKNVNYTKQPGQPEVLNITLNVDRYVGMGYTPTVQEVDLTAAKAYLGVEAITSDMFRIINPDETEVSDYAPFDGWFNAEGAPFNWTPDGDSKICVKFFQVADAESFEICDMNGADVLDAVYTVKWAIVANEKKVVYTINVKMTEKPIIDLKFADLTQVDEQSVDFKSETGKMYEALSADVDVAGILSTLGVAELSDVKIYAVQSDGSLDDNYQLGTTDGWRNADGDWQSWGDAAYFYVKADFARESAQIYEVGGMEGKNTEPASYTATYVFVKNGTTDAVVLKVNLVYDYPDGVNGIASDTEKAAIYDLSGRRVEKAQKGIYIINGKKFMVK